jgi:hypothetical protein
MNKEWKELARKAARKGWHVIFRANGHTTWIAPDGTKIYASGSPRTPGAIHAHTKQMKKLGGWQ